MKYVGTIFLALGVCLSVGCGKKEPELSTEKVITPGEAANKLFVESTKQMAQAVSKEENDDIDGAIAGYELVVANVRKLVNDCPESDIAVKLVSGETLFTGTSLEDVEERVKELKGQRFQKFMGMATNSPSAIFEGQNKLKQNGLYEITGHFYKHSTNAAGGIDIEPANGWQKGEPFSFETHIPEVFMAPLLGIGKFDSVPEE